MYFSENHRLREMEKLMRTIPNFRPRGHGLVILQRHDCEHCSYRQKEKGCVRVRCPCIDERIRTGNATLAEAVAETLKHITYPPFEERLKKYLKESEEHPMYFKNQKHRTIFAETVRKLDKKNYALMAAVYLLTAENRLWNSTGRYVEKNEIRFEDIHLRGSTENGYTLYCAAKDLYLGTKNLTVSDLADTTLIQPQTFGLVCNAMAVRRYGVGAVKFKERTDDV